jgi:hypothetical protein
MPALFSPPLRCHAAADISIAAFALRWLSLMIFASPYAYFAFVHDASIHYIAIDAIDFFDIFAIIFCIVPPAFDDIATLLFHFRVISTCHIYFIVCRHLSPFHFIDYASRRHRADGLPYAPMPYFEASPLITFATPPITRRRADARQRERYSDPARARDAQIARVLLRFCACYALADG